MSTVEFHKRLCVLFESVQVCVLTAPWSYQPAVQKASSQRIVEDHSPLTVDRLQYVLHGDWDVRVCVCRLLASFLALD